MWWEDRRKAAGHRLQDVAPEGFEPGRVMEIDEEIQLGQELSRIHGAKRGHLPRIRHLTQHVTYRISATKNLDDG